MTRKATRPYRLRVAPSVPCGGRHLLSTEVQSGCVANEPNDLLSRILEEVLDSRRALGEGIDGVGGRLDSFRNETLTNFDGAFLRLETVESELHAVSAALTRLERSVEGDRPRGELLREEIQIVKERLSALEKRLADLDGASAEPH